MTSVSARERGLFFQNFFGGHEAVVRPVPIPNTAVKHSIADGSSPIGSARVGSRQFFLKSRNESRFGFLLFTAICVGKKGTRPESLVGIC